jgi:uncharacterized membrane protein affecting hemolysin expression
MPTWAEAGGVEADLRQPERERLNIKTVKSKTVDFLCMIISPSLILGFVRITMEGHSLPKSPKNQYLSTVMLKKANE